MLLHICTAVLVLLAASVTMMVIDGFTVVDEGRLGVVFLFGQAAYSIGSGSHLRLPLVSSVRQMHINPHTYTLDSLECSTQSGVSASFDRVEIVAQLQASRLLEFVRNFSSRPYEDVLLKAPLRGLVTEHCSKRQLSSIVEEHATMDDWLERGLNEQLQRLTSGALKVVDIRLSRPRLPSAIQEQRAELEALLVKQRVVMEQRATALRNTEAAKRKAVIAAEQRLSVAAIDMQKAVSEAEGTKDLIIKRILTQAEAYRADADAEAYRLLREAESANRSLTPERLQLEAGLAMATNIRMYLGNSVPRAIIEEAPARIVRRPQPRGESDRVAEPSMGQAGHADEPEATEDAAASEFTREWESEHAYSSPDDEEQDVAQETWDVDPQGEFDSSGEASADETQHSATATGRGGEASRARHNPDSGLDRFLEVVGEPVAEVVMELAGAGLQALFA